MSQPVRCPLCGVSVTDVAGSIDNGKPVEWGALFVLCAACAGQPDGVPNALALERRNVTFVPPECWFAVQRWVRDHWPA